MIPQEELVKEFRARGFKYFSENDDHILYRQGKIIISIRKNVNVSEEHAKDVLSKSGLNTTQRDNCLDEIRKRIAVKKK